MALRDLPEVIQTSLLIVVLALGVRLVWLVESRHTLASDEFDYHQLAVSLVDQGTYAIQGIPTAYRPPGYPFVLWLVYSVIGVSPTAALVAQALLDAFLAVLLFLSLVNRNKIAARVAGISWALLPAAILYSELLLTETLFTALAFGAILLLSRRTSTRSAIAGGVLLGLACLIKPWLVIFVALVGFRALVRWESEKRLAIAAFVTVLSIVPWIARNHELFGVFSLSTNTGMNLYVGNNPNATGGYKGQFPEELVSAVGDERRLDSLSRELAIEYITSEPGQFLAGAVTKAARLLGSEGELLVFSLSPRDHGVRFSEQYRRLPQAAIILVNLPSFFFLVLGLAGLITAEKAIEWRSAMMFFAALLVTTIVFFGSSRFRYPLMPFLVMYGSIIVSDPRAYYESLSTSKKAACWIVSLVVIAVWVTEALLIDDA